MGTISVRREPPYPDIAETLEIDITDGLPSQDYQVLLDDAVLAMFVTDAAGNATESVSIVGHEYKVAPMHEARAGSPHRMHERIAMTSPTHSVVVRPA